VTETADHRLEPWAAIRHRISCQLVSIDRGDTEPLELGAHVGLAGCDTTCESHSLHA